MSNLPVTENLDERIERIRKRDEELEKKYREAEEDRLNALKDNAMVRTGVIKDEDWPRAHKYDKLDFTYDQKPEPEPESETITNLLPNEKPGLKTGRDYKKFADGQGPPADPTYNFLADSERDGSTPGKTDNKIHDKKDWRNPNNRGNNRSRGGRGRNDREGRPNHHGEYDAWKNERTIYDDARINRQKSNDGKWRREWDSEKFPEEENALKLEKISLDDSKSPEHKIARPIIQDGPVSRGNITVSITNDGEVKSVKCKLCFKNVFNCNCKLFKLLVLSPPAIGSGRVGPRQVTKPHFAVQINNEIDGQNNRKFSGNNNYQQKKDFNKKLPVQGNGFNNKPFPPKTTNIQDRLNRNRQPLPLKSSDENNGSPIVVNY